MVSDNNRYDLTTGRNEETDTELRQRYLESLAVTGVGTLDAIVAAVKGFRCIRCFRCGK